MVGCAFPGKWDEADQEVGFLPWPCGSTIADAGDAIICRDWPTWKKERFETDDLNVSQFLAAVMARAFVQPLPIADIQIATLSLLEASSRSTRQATRSPPMPDAHSRSASTTPRSWPYGQPWSQNGSSIRPWLLDATSCCPPRPAQARWTPQLRSPDPV